MLTEKDKITSNLKIGDLVKIDAQDPESRLIGLEGTILCLGVDPENQHVYAMVEVYGDVYLFRSGAWYGEPETNDKIGLIDVHYLLPIEKLSPKVMATKLFGNKMWHSISVYKPTEKACPCTLPKCNETAAKEAYVNIWGVVHVAPMCQHHYDLNHGKSVDDFKE